jgi:hypothetical protein
MITKHFSFTVNEYKFSFTTSNVNKTRINYMTLRMIGFLGFVHQWVFWKMKNTMFWILNLFPSSVQGREIPTLVGPLERANSSHWRARVI